MVGMKSALSPSRLGPTRVSSRVLAMMVPPALDVRPGRIVCTAGLAGIKRSQKLLERMTSRKIKHFHVLASRFDIILHEDVG